jgi:hypothetical protein
MIPAMELYPRFIPRKGAVRRRNRVTPNSVAHRFYSRLGVCDCLAYHARTPARLSRWHLFQCRAFGILSTLDPLPGTPLRVGLCYFALPQENAASPSMPGHSNLVTLSRGARPLLRSDLSRAATLYRSVGSPPYGATLRSVESSKLLSRHPFESASMPCHPVRTCGLTPMILPMKKCAPGRLCGIIPCALPETDCYPSLLCGAHPFNVGPITACHPFVPCPAPSTASPCSRANLPGLARHLYADLPVLVALHGNVGTPSDVMP